MIRRSFLLCFFTTYMIFAAADTWAAPIPHGRYKAACRCVDANLPKLPPVFHDNSEGQTELVYYADDDGAVEDDEGKADDSPLPAPDDEHAIYYFFETWILHTEMDLRFVSLLPKLYLKRHHRLLSPWELFILPNLEVSKEPGAGYASKVEAEKVLQDLWELPERDRPQCRIYKAVVRYPFPGQWDFTPIDVDDETQFLVDETGKQYALQVEIIEPPEEFGENDPVFNIRIDPETCVIIDSEIDPETKKPTRYEPNFPIDPQVPQVGVSYEEDGSSPEAAADPDATYYEYDESLIMANDDLEAGEPSPPSPESTEPADSDGDGLSDQEEIEMGLDPYSADSDQDGLGDPEEIAAGLDPLSPDTDGDGLDDYQEIYEFSSDPFSFDTDGDGLSDREEYDLGSDPTLYDSDGDGLSDQEEIAAGSDVHSYDTDGDGLSDGEEYDLGSDPILYDTDGDGLMDAEEFDLGSDVLSTDTDGDGLSDGDEYYYGSDPTLADTDGDGLSDADEYSAGSDPHDSDSDGDGLSDQDELEAGSDFFNYDTDGDGLSDGEEAFYGCSPINYDSDGDWLSDGEELSLGSDPGNPDSDGDGILDGEEYMYGGDPLSYDDWNEAELP